MVAGAARFCKNLAQFPHKGRVSEDDFKRVIEGTNLVLTPQTKELIKDAAAQFRQAKGNRFQVVVQVARFYWEMTKPEPARPNRVWNEQDDLAWDVAELETYEMSGL